MAEDAGWAAYLSARSAALSDFADSEVAAKSIARAEARLRTYLGNEQDEARVQARRCFFHATDAAFHDELLASADIDLLRSLVAHTEADDCPLLWSRLRGAVAVSLHYGPATSILPLRLAMASHMGMIGHFAVVQHSRNNPNVMLSAKRHAELCEGGFPFANLDIAELGELGALRRALGILRDGGAVLIFADGKLPQSSEKRTVTCQLGRAPLAFACGPEWLARNADVALLPLLLRPKGNCNQLASFPAAHPEAASGAIQALLDAAMDFDPAPWSHWCSHASHF